MLIGLVAGGASKCTKLGTMLARCRAPGRSRNLATARQRLMPGINTVMVSTARQRVRIRRTRFIRAGAVYAEGTYARSRTTRCTITDNFVLGTVDHGSREIKDFLQLG